MIANIIVFTFFGVGLVAILHYVFRWLRVLWIQRKYIPQLILYYIAKCKYPSGASCQICANYVKLKDNKDNMGSCILMNSYYCKGNYLCSKWKALGTIEEKSIVERVLSKTW